MNEMSEKNIALWDSVAMTDPAFTKEFSRGDFKGTAIVPAWLVRAATQKFGPMGIGWGVKVVDERYVEGGPLGFRSSGEPVRAIVHTLRALFWYVWEGKRGEIEHFGNTTFVGRNADGSIFTNEEANKMSMTDVTVKCLNQLGFGADVHLGLYDDVKYVNAAESHFASLAEMSQQLQNGDQPHPGRQLAQGQPKLSDRYEAMKQKVLGMTLKERITAIKLIKQDQNLSEIERNLLLATPEMKEALEVLEAATGEPGATKQGAPSGRQVRQNTTHVTLPL